MTTSTSTTTTTITTTTNDATTTPTGAAPQQIQQQVQQQAHQPPPNPEDVLNINIGILGHVDSGKTSLVKTLSTLLSTAALDKSKQSRQRGMTLDLGFSCFFLDLPNHLQQAFPTKSKLQLTLVDCPGHASLIRTIIGGAQIIDMIVLVVDAYKGWQAQTTECLVLAELTSSHLMVALNKVDMFPQHERSERIEQAKRSVQDKLSQSTKFNAQNVIMVGVSACIGGEKRAAQVQNKDGSIPEEHHVSNMTKINPTYNIDVLIQTLQESLPIPKRDTILLNTTNNNNNNNNNKKGNEKTSSTTTNNNNSPSSSSFYFAIDHCFPIKGMGTVLTGTVLSGSVKVNDTIEFPTLGRLERKIKSMQMFKRKCKQIQQGDRAGICVSSLDATLLERGIAASPGSVHLFKGAIALVRKIPYYMGGKLQDKTKFHISVGHTTIMATVSFFGAQELLLKQQKESTTTTNNDEDGNNNTNHDPAGIPIIPFDWNQIFLQQNGYIEYPTLATTTTTTKDNNNNNSTAGSATTNTSKTTTTTTDSENAKEQQNEKSKKQQKQQLALNWAIIDFQTPVYCPMNALIIGSRLDGGIENTANNNNNTAADGTGNSNTVTTTSSSSSSSCRLAFCGRLIEKINNPKEDIPKQLRLYTPKERTGGIIFRLGDPHKRQDDGKIVRYEVFGSELFKKETLLKPFLGMKIVTYPTGDIGEIKSAFGTSGKFRIVFPGGTEAREGDSIVLPFERFLYDVEKKMRQEHLMLPPSRPGTRLDPSTTSNNNNKKGGGKNNNNNNNNKNNNNNNNTNSKNNNNTNNNKNKNANTNNNKKQQQQPQQPPEAAGIVEKVKGDLVIGKDENNKKYSMAIISGMFTPEQNIREKIGWTVLIPKTNEKGKIVGAFGKAGKCKVEFGNTTNEDDIASGGGIAESSTGEKAELYAPTTTTTT